MRRALVIAALLAACGKSSSEEQRPPATVLPLDAAPAPVVTDDDDRVCRGLTDQIATKFVDNVLADAAAERRTYVTGRVAEVVHDVCATGGWGARIAACGGQADCTDSLTTGMMQELGPRFAALLKELATTP